MEELLNSTFFGNSARSWLIVVAVVTVALITLKIIKIVFIRKVVKWVQKTRTSWDNFIVEMIERNVAPVLYISAFYFPLLTLDFNGKVLNILHIAYLIALTFYTLRTISAAFKKFIHSFIKKDEDS